MKKNVPKKTPSRRSRAKYPGLSKTYTLKRRVDILEIDYLDKLNDYEKQWLNDFHEEYINTNFKKGRFVEDGRTKRALYTENNIRNRDIYTLSKAGNTLVFFEDLKDSGCGAYNILFNDETKYSDDSSDHSSNGGNDLDREID